MEPGETVASQKFVTLGTPFPDINTDDSRGEIQVFIVSVNSLALNRQRLKFWPWGWEITRLAITQIHRSLRKIQCPVVALCFVALSSIVG